MNQPVKREVCERPKCDLNVYALGLCWRHYQGMSYDEKREHERERAGA